MARRNTTTTEKSKTAADWFAEMADKTLTRHRRIYAGSQGVKHLFTEESRKPVEECDDLATAEYLADYGELIATLCDRKGLLAEAKAKKGASMTARRNSGASPAVIAAAVNAAVAAAEQRQAAVIAELMARLAAVEAPPAPPAKKGGRVSLK